MYTREVFNEQLSFPPYYLSKDHDGKIVIAGGGGASKTGITNQIVM